MRITQVEALHEIFPPRGRYYADMTLLSRLLGSVRSAARLHPRLSAAVLILLLAASLYGYRLYTDDSQETRYAIGSVRKGSIIATVSASGQVTPSNQVDIKSKVSGDVVSIAAKSGQTLAAGSAIAYLDASDARKAVRDAQNAVETAQLALEKLKEPADALSITQARNALAKAEESRTQATEDLADAYIEGFDDVTDTFLEFPNTMTGIYDSLYKSNTQLGGANVSNLDFYAAAIDRLTTDLDGTRTRRDVASRYEAAKKSYDAAFADYRAASRSSDPATVARIMQETYDAATLSLDTVKAFNNMIQFYKETSTTKSGNYTAYADTQLSGLNGYTSTLTARASALSSRLSAIKSAQQAIVNAERSIQENGASLAKIQQPADALDLRSAEITLEQRQNALTDATETLSDYTIRAPFAGTLASLAIDRGDSVSAGGAVASLVTKQQIAELSLNEVDAAKVKVGQKATITFDAIDDLSITGEVAEVDLVGTVSQGVVSYTVSIAFDAQDDRIRPGMTANATIAVDSADDALIVPSSAVKTQNGTSYVLVYDGAVDTGKTYLTGIETRRVPVTTGLTDDTDIAITSGLEEGMHIVTRTYTSSDSSSSSSSGSSQAAGPGGPEGGMMRF